MNVCHSIAQPGEDGIADGVCVLPEWFMGILVILTTHSPDSCVRFTITLRLRV